MRTRKDEHEFIKPNNIHILRDAGRVGGLMAIFNSGQLINIKPKLNYNTFEDLILTISDLFRKVMQPILFAMVYQASGPYTENVNRIFRDFFRLGP